MLIHLDLQSVESMGVIQMPSTIVCLDKTSVIIGNPNLVNICNYQGIIKQFVKIDESEGELSHMDVTDDQTLLIATSKFAVKTYDLSRRDPKLLTSRIFEEYLELH